jgi:ABC-type multidrug transport system permease subunit
MDRHRRHVLVTLGILAAGFAVAVPVYLHGSAQESLPFELTEDGKKYLYNIQQMQGQEGLLIAQLSNFWSGLWRGWELGITLAVITCVIALAYYLIATRTKC